MTRVSVMERIAAILDAAPSARSGLPAAWTHHNLACEVYGTDSPTAAQLSAVRRGTAKLVAAGRAEREERDLGPRAWRGTHWRRRNGEEYVAYNPSPALVRRAMTEADRLARAAVLEKYGLRDD